MLAEHYREAAHLLLERAQGKNAMARAPFRLCAIHAIELYLNAMLLHQGWRAADIRGLQHNLADRLDRLTGVRFRKLTQEHIRTLVQTREYLTSRYAPDRMKTASEVNRLTATLDQVAQKASETLKLAPLNVGVSGISR